MTSTPAPVSTPCWPGSQPCRFSGGRLHNNHPRDQLDNLLLGHASQQKLLGPSKHRIATKSTLGTVEQFKPSIRVDPYKNQSQIVFTAESVPRLIKISPADAYKESNSIVFRGRGLGESKVKGLQEGKLKTGIYRNYYRSQFKYGAADKEQ